MKDMLPVFLVIYGGAMNLSHLEYFKKLAEIKHYTKAATELYIAQPTLSVAISSLEKELGAPLFERKNNQILLTPCGEQFYHYVCIALQNLDKGVTAVREYAGMVNGHINLGTLYAMQGKYWSEAIRAFHEEYGAPIQINIAQGFTPTLTRDLKADKFDVIFAGQTESDPDLIAVPCWSQELAVAVNKAHPLAQKKEISLDDLANYHILTYKKSSIVADELMSVLGSRDLDIEFEYNDEITLSSLVTSNKTDVSLLCYSFLVKAFDDVVFLPLKEAPKDFHKVYLLSKKHGEKSQLIRDFITFMSSYYFPPARVGA